LKSEENKDGDCLEARGGAEETAGLKQGCRGFNRFQGSFDIEVDFLGFGTVRLWLEMFSSRISICELSVVLFNH
jgi:hypothetical protein